MQLHKLKTNSIVDMNDASELYAGFLIYRLSEGFVIEYGFLPLHTWTWVKHVYYACVIA